MMSAVARCFYRSVEAMHVDAEKVFGIWLG